MLPRIASTLSRRQLLVLQCNATPKSYEFGKRHHTFRFFSSSSQHVGNPYEVLGVPINSDYSTVKQAFLRAALEHHPDQQDRDEARAATDRFVRIRKAFEDIACDKQDANEPASWKNDPDLTPYFHATNEFLTFHMDDQTRKEVIHAFKTLSHGGKDKGGYWDMARQITEREDAAPSDAGEPMRQLSTGKPSLSRRRRKR